MKKKKRLIREALSIEKAGAFSIVLECVTPKHQMQLQNY